MPKQRAPVPRFYRTHELTEMFGVSTPTVFRWRAAGKLPRPVHDPGGQLMWPADMIDQMIEDGTERLIRDLEIENREEGI